jgi:hypothetical protein
MEIDNYKPNSDKSKSNEIRKVEVANGTREKASVAKKMLNIFLGEDIADVKKYVIWDVIVPGIRDFAWNIWRSTGDSMFGRSDDRRDSRDSNRRGRYRSYDEISRHEQRRDRERVDPFTPDDISFDTRREAVDVLAEMRRIIRESDVVRVGEFYDLSKVVPENTDSLYRNSSRGKEK